MNKYVALVTGAGSGIGKASALALAMDGYAVGVLGHSRDELRQTVGEIEAAGGEACVLQADIAAEAEMRNAMTPLMERWDRLDVVVANAGINGVWAPIDDLTLDEWNRTISVNLTGTFLTIRS